MTIEDERLEQMVRSAVLGLAVPATTVVDAKAAMQARRADRQRLSALLVAAVVATALVTTSVVLDLGEGTTPSTAAAPVPALTSGASDGAASAPSSDWEDWVVPSPRPSDIPAATLETAEQVNAIFRGWDDDWAKAHYDEDRTTVVINVKIGHEAALAEQIARARAIDLAPVRIRPVEYSFNDLMSRVRPLTAYTRFAGSRMTGARVDAELNSLVIAVDTVTPEVVQAVHDAVGDDTYVEERALATWSVP